MPLSPTSFVSFEISSHPTVIYQNPIDLDVWLDLHSANESENAYTHRQVLAAIGNTVGARVDRNIHPLVAALRLTKSATAGGGEYDLVVDYVRHVAIVALQLSQSTLRLS